MNLLEHALSELAAREAGCSADLPDPSDTDDLAAGHQHCSELAEKAVESARYHLRHVARLRDEVAEVRSENDRLRTAVVELHSQVADGPRREDDLRAEATAQHDRAAEAEQVRSELERRLLEVEDRLRTATEESGQLESELQFARSRLAELEHEIAQKSTGVAGDLDAAERRIEQLTVDLQWAHNANARLRSLLNVVGLVDHLEPRPESD